MAQPLAADLTSPVLSLKRKSSPGPLTRRQRCALFPDELKLSDPKSLLTQMGAADVEDETADADFRPGAESDVEEEYDEGDIRDDDRPPFDDPAPADPALVQQLANAGEEADDADFRPAAVESDVEEEFDEGDVRDDDRPPFDDDSEPAVDPALAKQLGVAGGEVEDEEDEDFAPGGAESEVEEEYDEGPIADDERPPFDDGEVAEADPSLVRQLEAADDDAEGVDFAPEAESEVEEEYDEGDVRDDDRPPFDDE